MRLSVQIEFDKTLDIVTKKNNVVVGRADDCDLIVPHNSISRKHCRIEFIDNKFFITDLGSSNGTSLNGKRLVPDHRERIPEGSLLGLGGLDCEVSDYIPKVEQEKVISRTTSDRGDFTSTIRMSRIDLNQPSVALELERKKSLRPQGPRNPVIIKEEVVVEKSNGLKKLLFIVLALILLALAWYLGR